MRKVKFPHRVGLTNGERESASPGQSKRDRGMTSIAMSSQFFKSEKKAGKWRNSREFDQSIRRLCQSPDLVTRSFCEKKGAKTEKCLYLA